MPLDSNANRFLEWAQRIGCPIQHIPRKAAIVRNISSGRSPLETIMVRVLMVDEANEVRTKILIKSMNLVDSKRNVSCYLYYYASFLNLCRIFLVKLNIPIKNLPTELVRYEKIQKCVAHLNADNEELTRQKEEIENLQCAANKMSEFVRFFLSCLQFHYVKLQAYKSEMPNTLKNRFICVRKY